MLNNLAMALDPETEKEDTIFSNIDYLQQRLNSSNISKSEDAALELASLGAPAANILSIALMSESTHVVVNAARGLGIVGEDADKAVFNLVWVLFHPETERRASAAAALGRMKTKSRVAIHALGASLRDKEKTVRQYAAASLGEFEKNELEYVFKELTIAARDIDKDVRVFAQYALSKISK